MNNQFSIVSNFNDFISKPFLNETNAVCWSRLLEGDFTEIVEQLITKKGVLEIDNDDLNKLELTANGALARDIILKDLRALTDLGKQPTLNLINHYDRDDSFSYFPTDVYSWHVDRSPIPTETILCTYHGTSSDILPNKDAEQKILNPEIRNELKKLYVGPEAGFDEFLQAYFFDLHYQAIPDAIIINLGVGHLWKLAVDHPDSNSLPSIHRAPLEKTGEPRLLLIC